MSANGPEIETPLKILIKLVQGVEEPKTLLDLAKERPKRIFSDILKTIDRPAHDSTLFKSGEIYDHFKETLLKFNTPIKEDFGQEVSLLFAKTDKILLEDPGWDQFWTDLQKKDNLSDENLNYLKEQSLTSLRFKLMSNAMAEIMGDPQVQATQKKQAQGVLAVLQIFNGQYDQHKDDLFEHTREDYKNKSAISYAQEVNGFIAEAAAKLAKGESLEEVKQFLEEKRNLAFETCKRNDGYANFYGEDKARIIFDENFTTDAMLGRAKNYQSVCEKVGFDIIERVSMLNEVKTRVIEKQHEIEDQVRFIRRLAFFPDSQLKSNEDIHVAPPNLEAVKQSSERLHKELESRSKDQLAVAYVTAINSAIKEAIERIKKGDNPDEVKRDLEIKRNEIFENGKSKDHYYKYFNPQDAKAVFDKTFSPEILNAKVDQYSEFCKEIGFDVNERSAMLETIKDKSGTVIGAKGQDLAGQLAELTKNLYYFSEPGPNKKVDTNTDINTKGDLTSYKKAFNESSQHLENGLVDAIMRRDFDTAKEFAKAGIVSNLKSDTYKRSFMERLKDGFKDFPTKLRSLFVTPERTMSEIVKMAGRTDITEQLQQNDRQAQKPPYDTQQVQQLEDAMTDIPLSGPSLSNTSELTTRPPSITLLKDQITQELPKNATPLQAFQHDVKAMMQEIEKAKQVDPYQAMLLNIDLNALKSIAEQLTSPNFNPKQMSGIYETIRQAEMERKKANHDLPTTTSFSNKMLEMTEKHEAKLLSAVTPEVEKSKHSNLKSKR